MADDPKWPRAAAWLSGAHAANPACRLSVLGAPLRLGSITPGRYDLAPQAIREILSRFSTFDLEFDRDLTRIAARDLGDLPLSESTPGQALEPLSNAVSRALAETEALVLIGGDNSITRPGCHGAAGSVERCGLLTLDAHLDLRDLSPALSNGNPVRALLADGLPGPQIVQIGIQPFANTAPDFHFSIIFALPVNGISIAFFPFCFFGYELSFSFATA